MKLVLGVFATATLALSIGLAADAQQVQPAAQTGAAPTARQATPPSPASPARPATVTTTVPTAAESQNALLKQYCVGCHSDRGKAGGLSLAAYDVSKAADHADISEKIIRKLRAGMMPPSGARRPEGPGLVELAASLEQRIDRAAALAPNPGWRPFQRLNRVEYARAVSDLVGIDVDVTAFLPGDTTSAGFDNVADVQGFSATLMEGYLRAASRISSLAVGDPLATPSEVTYKVPRTANQMEHTDGAPMGTRGGVSVVHVFPADGEYQFKIMLHSIPTGQLFGSSKPGEKIEVSVNGERVALLDINTRMSESDPTGMTIATPKIAVKAGPQRLTAAFLTRWEGPVDDIIAPIEHTLADTQIGSGFGVTALAHVRDFSVSGPFNVTGVSDTASRRRLFSCRPTSPTEEMPCATEIFKRLATQAYRGPVSTADLDGLLGFYKKGRDEGDFESGVRVGLQALLASPKFLFRLEETPAAVRPGQTYRIADIELASRLSFFLWGSMPDAELVKAATQGTLDSPIVLEKQVRRMLADPRSEALATRFAAQWLGLQDLKKINPDALLYPQYDATLGEALRRETELFFDSLVRDDKSLIEFLTADYTFVNERVAKHYGIPNVTGTDFRRVTLADDSRRGILGHASVLTMTSIADRTSPVLRGKWIMGVLLGSPPPPPPPNVPTLEETKGTSAGRILTVRQRMEEHRANPACTSCHKVIDPLGLALENFDVTGAWRRRDSGNPIDSAGELYDGTKMTGPADLRKALLSHQDVFVTTFTENLMTYALGRRVETYDMPTVRTIVREAGKQDHRMSAFILGVVKSPAFQMSRAERAETTEVASKH